MKIKNRLTGEVLPVPDDSLICGIRNGEEVEFYAHEVEIVPESWDAFRANAAKDILCALLMSGHGDSWKNLARMAIEGADTLIKQLQEDKKRARMN